MQYINLKIIFVLEVKVNLQVYMNVTGVKPYKNCFSIVLFSNIHVYEHTFYL